MRTNTHSRRIGLSVAALTIGIALAATVTWAATKQDEPASDGAPVSFAPVGDANLPKASSPEDALTAALNGPFEKTAIVGASYGSIPAGAPVSDDGLWLNVHVSGTNEHAGATLGDWESAMLIGYLRDVLHTSDLAPLGGYSLYVDLPDGRSHELGGGGPGNIAFGQQFVTTPRDTLADQLRDDAASYGVDIQDVSFLPTENPVPIITIVAPDPKEFVKNHPSLTALFSKSGPFEGIYVQLVDDAGNPVEVGSAAFRSGIGNAWYASGYDGGDRAAGP